MAARSWRDHTENLQHMRSPRGMKSTLEPPADDATLIRQSRNLECHRTRYAWLGKPAKLGAGASSTGVLVRGRHMTVNRKTVTFTCLNCDALYQVVKTGPEQETVDRWATCRSCGGPLPARDGKYVLKYFLLRKAIANRKWRRKPRPAVPI